MSLSHQIMRRAIAEELGSPITSVAAVTGGCINDAFVYNTSTGRYFVKVNPAPGGGDLLAAEAEGVRALRNTQTMRLPEPLLQGSLPGAGGYLVLEYLELASAMSEAAQEQLGRQLAALHLSGGSDRFGFDIDTSLGLALQNNSWSDTWVTFVQQQRIAPQLELAYGPYGGSGLKTLGEAFLPQLSEAFEGLKITPSLLHGDLWSGNAAADLSGQPVIFDPAPYYGHHEAELSIMRLLGGFSERCFQAYHELIPPAPGFEIRLQIYTLYHLLNHLNLFGPSYLSRCLDLLKCICSGTHTLKSLAGTARSAL